MAAAPGVLPRQSIRNLIDAGHVSADGAIPESSIQPASLDLRLGPTAYRLRCSFLPGSRTVRDKLREYQMGELDLAKGAVLEQHCEAIGRDPKSIKHSAQAMLTITDDAEAAEKARGGGRPVIVGSVSQIQEILGQYQEAGVDELIIPDFNLGNAEQKKATYDQFINEIAKPFRA